MNRFANKVCFNVHFAVTAYNGMPQNACCVITVHDNTNKLQVLV